MTARVVLGVSSFAVGSAFGLKATATLRRIIDQVNERLPEGQQIGLIAGAPTAIVSEYRRLYPGGNQATRFWKFFWLSMAFVALASWPILFG